MNEKSIHERLENWGRVYGGRAPTGPASMTGAICDRLRKAALGVTISDRPELDEADALVIERARGKLLEFRHKEMLRWLYVRNAHPQFICRKLGLRPFPTTVFDAELGRATSALQKVLDSTQERHKIPSNNLLPST